MKNQAVQTIETGAIIDIEILNIIEPIRATIEKSDKHKLYRRSLIQNDQSCFFSKQNNTNHTIKLKQLLLPSLNKIDTNSKSQPKKNQTKNKKEQQNLIQHSRRYSHFDFSSKTDRHLPSIIAQREYTTFKKIIV